MVPRRAAQLVRRYAREFRVVAVLGPRQSGKTTLVRTVFPAKPYVSLEDPDERSFATDDPRGFLHRFPRGAVLDEVQRTPQILSYLQGVVDRSTRHGQFVLTGSQQFHLLETITQTLAGRVGTVELLPFSYEELDAAGLAPTDLADALWRGGYPPLSTAPRADPVRWLNAYVRTYVERDVRAVVTLRDLDAFQRVLRLCAAHAGQLVNTAQIGADAGVSHNTVRGWLGVLEAGFILFRLQPSLSNLRKRLVKTPKLYFYDTGLLSRLLGVVTAEQLVQHPLRGAIFENWVLVEALKAIRNRGGEPDVAFWRDALGHEVDIVRREGDRTDAWECKSGATYVPEWATALNYWRGHAGAGRHSMAVVYGGDATFTRSGVQVISWRDVASSVAASRRGQMRAATLSRPRGPRGRR